jgi:hypothetical protein
MYQNHSPTKTKTGTRVLFHLYALSFQILQVLAKYVVMFFFFVNCDPENSTNHNEEQHRKCLCAINYFQMLICIEA